jgi:hypothetical protein
VAAVVAGWSGSVLAATPAQVCEARKLEAAGNKANCLLRAYAAQVQGKAANFDRCEAEFTTAFDKAEKPGECPTEGDTAAIEAQVDAAAANLAAALSGATPPATHQFPATGQTTCRNNLGAVIPCAGTGQDGETKAGAVLSYTDNGDGTITDNNTGLMWEKKSDDGSIHAQAATYTWANAFAVHIVGLNTMNAGVGFAGHTDWRLPNVKELHSILNYENVIPAVSPAFNTGCVAACTVLTCSCTAPATFYWSSSTSAASTPVAWSVSFAFGFVLRLNDDTNLSVRAVRGGFLPNP